MKPDDIFLVMGAAWADAAFGERLRAVRKSYGMKPVLLIYDLIPLTCPEWFPPQVVSTFSAWLENVIPQCSDIMVISHATKKDVQDFLVQRSLHLNQAPWVVPMGGGFGDMSVATSGPDAPGLPPAKSYVLFVSTLEARKNHILMFQVWARLLREKAYTDVPTLVFAGRPASMVEDLMQQMENTDYLDGKVRLIREPSDEELRCLYKNCLFTVFPSLYEGWGLPVTESLLFGRPCVASNVTSIPEAGGDFARYFDPYDFETVYDTICRTIEDREGLKAWEDQIRKNFRPTPWSDTAKAILQSCEVAHQSSQPTLRRAG
ncbi:lipopolysaccharide N-acetylglucosaminyltransferase [Gluconobacter frateurii NRIC 0228]|uniref:Lipopolysaccharide N-acetylglucosaminyltransferase n=2 Tax=Gluconobacter frateurii TaxID=38308 RepID=A0ABQ0Q9N3_9PROT|nr:lipopolysaccharide N-acetylglucosaminyltransferase [Gluconobacter frateurii NRIC 0228]